MKFQASSVLVLLGTLSAFVSAAPKHFLQAEQANCECSTAVTDELIFEVSMSVFQERRAAKDPECCDWSADGCSWSPDNPFNFNFLPGCERHDFGYRNYKAQDRFTEDARRKIDDNFKSDLYNQCTGDKEDECKSLADIYYAAVRRCGDGNCFDKRLESVSS